MLLGYMATSNTGRTVHLDGLKHPRKRLLEKLGRKHCQKIYRDNATTDEAEHVGYIVDGEWWSIYEVHSWRHL